MDPKLISGHEVSYQTGIAMPTSPRIAPGTHRSRNRLLLGILAAILLGLAFISMPNTPSLASLMSLNLRAPSTPGTSIRHNTDPVRLSPGMLSVKRQHYNPQTRNSQFRSDLHASHSTAAAVPQMYEAEPVTEERPQTADDLVPTSVDTSGYWQGFLHALFLIPIAIMTTIGLVNRNRIMPTLPSFDGKAMAMMNVEATETDPIADYVKSRGGNLPIRKILIANNGMAATKCIFSMRQWAYMELGDEKAIHFVAMATPEDLKANAKFVQLADSFVEVPGGVNRNNYANVNLIVDLAKQNGVDAVWPGWGHASENPLLPASLKAAGIKFIGPTSPVMSVLGDKIAANILAQTAKVPSIPWSGDGLTAQLTEEGTIPKEVFDQAMVTTVDEALAVAENIGYPVMLKASEGGGGKGIRMSDNPDQLRTNFTQVENEVPGSPMFMMQLCTGARHLEVQIVGDEHGNAVALNGRDCSTQRRFQKIFEEGPPVIAPPATFREMEKAAQELTRSIGYIGAGTVEYLFEPATGKYYFLELNPRLQVEHPVTEGLTGVNLPATQLQVAMGIPLNCIPEIRRLYGREDTYGSSPIDFIGEDYKTINTHVIAARITAENPDEAFKPTSGTIENVKFQPTNKVWGYFSVGSNGGIHEYADSQFGHVFANGPDREQARRALVLALKDMEVRGEIRTTVEYLVQLLETDAFKGNSIDTSWLDGIIKQKSLGVSMDNQQIVIAAVLYRSFEKCKAEEQNLIKSLEKGQLSMADIKEMLSFPVEIVYAETKYQFMVTRTSPETFQLTINDQSIKVRIRQQPDGSMLAAFGGQNHQMVAREEPLGLRMVLDGQTVLLRNVQDPSELRSDVNGKVVRYLQDPGSEIEAGQPYVEVEAMKMIMALNATESGKISPEKAPGSIISAGDLLASLQLRDPSKVQKIVPFSGELDISSTGDEDSATPLETLQLVLDGYACDVDTVVQELLDSAQDTQEAQAYITQLLERYLAVESLYSGFTADEANQMLVKDKKDNLMEVVTLNIAHSALAQRNSLVLYLLRSLLTFRDRFGGDDLEQPLKDAILKLTQLQGQQYREVVLMSAQMFDMISGESFEEKMETVKAQLANEAEKISLSSGIELVPYFFGDSDEKTRTKALETYIRRIYAPRTMQDLTFDTVDGKLCASWKFENFDVSAKDHAIRSAFALVLPKYSVKAVEEALPVALEKFKGSLDEEKPDKPINLMHFVFTDGSDFNDGEVSKIEALMSSNAKSLSGCGIKIAHVLIPNAPNTPLHHSFTAENGYKEDTQRRHMRPAAYDLMELGKLYKTYDLQRMPAISARSYVYLGTEKPIGDSSRSWKRGVAPQALFLRSLTDDPSVVTPEGAMRAMTTALDELDRAQLDPRVSPTASGRIYVHLLPSLSMTPKEAAELWKEVIYSLLARNASRLLKLRVDQIEAKIRVEAPDGSVTPLRLIASSMAGEWLRTDAYTETQDALTGVATQFCTLEKENAICFESPYSVSGAIQYKRAEARRIGSTYAYDFLALMEVTLIQQWQAHMERTGVQGKIPESFFSSARLSTESGQVVPEKSYIAGDNKIGMLAWHITMKTPEYPNGREIVVIANDVTVQSGSFSVEEDKYFQKVSAYAREKGLPRIYISCNSGARIGLAEELKPLFQIAWVDQNNPSSGLDYLYLSENDYKTIDESSVRGEWIEVSGEKRFKLSDIVGTKRGIGVENLKGAGLIAGETSRAYEDSFTLSYVTGRSVGIGAYLVRLGQRTIQMQVGPMILTGFSALNKLLGRNVYTSQDQLGGPQIMVPNGVTHLLVQNDEQGVQAILEWLAFVPKDTHSLPPMLPITDPVDRDVEFTPSKTPYDPRHMLAGVTMPDGTWQSGFFDRGTFKETLAEWGKSVVVGRARLGGIPFGVIAVETRQVEQRIPADPANPASSEAIQAQAGQVWYPDSAYKTAQAIQDFNKGENLPLIIFANWRGFSGGTRDMYDEILKFGSMIVNGLVKYQHPVFIYIPPGGELRGGAWVVIDPAINPAVMEMYADGNSRGGILEAPGICEVKFRGNDQKTKMHQLDPTLIMLDSRLKEATTNEDVDHIREQVKEREEALLPLYMQVAHEFADLHDRSGRMQAVGVVREALDWRKARAYFFWRAKRRVLEFDLRKKMMAANSALTIEDATAKIKSLVPDYDDDKAFIEYMESHEAETQQMVSSIKKEAITITIKELLAQLSEDEREEVLSESE